MVKMVHFMLCTFTTVLKNKINKPPLEKKKVLPYTVGSQVIPVSCQPPPHPKDRETTAESRGTGPGAELSASEPGVDEEALLPSPSLHSVLVPELPAREASVQEASTTQPLSRILEIRRFAGVDINSPKLPVSAAEPASRA